MLKTLTDILLAALIPLIILIHLYFAPYTKVEESFNIQAVHDILTYGLPYKNIQLKLQEQYDHLEFSGAVPRTFVGSLVLAMASLPFASFVKGFSRQMLGEPGFPAGLQSGGATVYSRDNVLILHTLVRAMLGLFNAFCILSFRNGVAKTFGRNAANWFLVLQASQFHTMYYASRTLPNFFAYGLSMFLLSHISVSICIDFFKLL